MHNSPQILVVFWRAAAGRHWGADSSADSMSSWFPVAGGRRPPQYRFWRVAAGRHWGADSAADSMSSWFPVAGGRRAPQYSCLIPRCSH